MPVSKSSLNPTPENTGTQGKPDDKTGTVKATEVQTAPPVVDTGDNKTDTTKAAKQNEAADRDKERIENEIELAGARNTADEANSAAGYHDSLTGRAVDSNGNFADGTEGQVPRHRIVASDWAESRPKLDPKSPVVVQAPAVTHKTDAQAEAEREGRVTVEDGKDIRTVGDLK